MSNGRGNDMRIVDLTPETIADYGVCGYKKAAKHIELQRKIEWFATYYPLGLRIKAIVSDDGGYQGMIEYIPGEYVHRPVAAHGYLCIHCIFVGFKKEFKGRGYASALLDTCIEESRQAGKHGVAVVARKGSFMAGSALFLKKGFMTVDRATPDFELLALKCRDCAPDPSFKIAAPDAAARGLTIMRSPQCPYSVKNVDAIMQTAKGLGLPVSLRELPDAESAQRSPCAFGAFCIMHDNEIISHHPISNTRFTSIMKSRLSR